MTLALPTASFSVRTLQPGEDEANKTVTRTSLVEAINTITAKHAMLEEDRRKGEKLSLGLEDVDGLIGGGLELGACHEVRAELARDLGAAAGFLIGILAMLAERQDGKLIWITDVAIRHECGLLCPQGLAQFGIDPTRFVFVHPPDLKSGLWAADEASKCQDVMGVVLHMKGNPQAFDLTATRRLSLHATQSGVSLFILRQSGGEEASSALTRWQVKALDSLPGNQTDLHKKTKRPDLNSGNSSLSRLIGPVRLAVGLEKNRNGPLGEWAMSWSPLERKFSHAATIHTTNSGQTTHSGPAPAPDQNRPDRPDAMGQVVALAKTG